MELAEILNEIRERGLRAVIRDGVLFVGPGEKVSDDLRAALKANMPDLLAHYASAGNEEVRWRVAAMLEQLLPLAWPCPVPCLFARREAGPGKHDCKSCGELLDVGEGNTFVCGPCARAKHLAIELWMQRPAETAKVA
jgi:hypothetical protein